MSHAQSAASPVVVNAMQWNSLSHIADMEPIGDADGPCLEEIRQVLLRHGREDRFGVSLLHSHFPVGPGEQLLETTDVDKREQLVRVVKTSFLEENGIQAQATVIGFDKSGFRQICGCNPRSTGHFHL
jgi:hypothetical protein